MKRRALLAIVVPVVGISWWLHAADDAQAPVATSGTATAARTPPPRLPAPAVPAVFRTSPGPTDDVQTQLDEILAQLRHTARRCLVGRSARPHPPGEADESLDRVALRAKILFDQGMAATASLEKSEDGFVDQALERCVLDAIRGARWRTAQPDGTLRIEHALYVGELMGRDPLAPPRVGRRPRPEPLAGVPKPTMPPVPLSPGVAPRLAPVSVDPSAANRTP